MKIPQIFRAHIVLKQEIIRVYIAALYREKDFNKKFPDFFIFYHYHNSITFPV